MPIFLQFTIKPSTRLSLINATVILNLESSLLLRKTMKRFLMREFYWVPKDFLLNILTLNLMNTLQRLMKRKSVFLTQMIKYLLLSQSNHSNFIKIILKFLMMMYPTLSKIYLFVLTFQSVKICSKFDMKGLTLRTIRGNI